MTGTGYQVEGLREKVRALEQAGVEVSDLKDVFIPIAAEGAEVGRARTPRRSGALAATARGSKAKNKALVTFGTARVRYAGAILFGSPKRNIKAATTIAQTDEVMEKRAPELLEKGLTRVYERYEL